jgi:hypothetical protein
MPTTKTKTCIVLVQFRRNDVRFFKNGTILPQRGPVLGGPLVYVAGTFSKWTSLTQTFLLSRGRCPHYFSSNSCQKSGCLGTYF